MLVNMNDLLLDAKKNHYAIPAVNVDNEHNLRAAIQASEECRAPLIIQFVPSANPDIVYFGKIARDLISKASTNIVLNLDHGKNFADCMKGIQAGCTNIMIDRSLLPFEENVKEVKEMVKICHSLGITVEAELGYVGMGNQYDGNNGLTQVEEAISFVEQTKVDALAVAIGTAHGVYKGKPTIHFDLLHALDQSLSIPLVLHGGSGTGIENLKRCAHEGIHKINVSKDLKRAAIHSLMQEDLQGNGVYNLYVALAKGYKDEVKKYIELFR
ncbi:MAG: class II fructose-bisphosphate aldolase [Floccifex sp.]